VPSQLHEILLLLLRNRPELAPELLREALHVELPPYSEVRLESAELTDVVPTEYRADLVVLLVDGKPVLGIVVEVQLNPDPRKQYTWPVYVASLRARIECPCCLLVITPSPKTADWASQPITVGPGNELIPLVVAPTGIPIVTDFERAATAPELAVLSVMAHGHGDVETAVKIACCASQAAALLYEDRLVLYSDLIDHALGEAARKALEMLPHNYEFQGPTYKRAKREGQLTMGTANLFDFLDARGLTVSDATRERVLACTDLDQLRRWVRRAAIIQSAEELFDE
jgi:hypothetical protein